MAAKHNSVHKRTKQGGQKKTATMNKSEKRTYKKYFDPDYQPLLTVK